MNKEATNNVIFQDGKAGKSKVENDLQKVPIINWIYKTKSLCFFYLCSIHNYAQGVFGRNFLKQSRVLWEQLEQKSSEN